MPTFYIIDESLTVVATCGDAPLQDKRLPLELERLVVNLQEESKRQPTEPVAYDEGWLVRLIPTSSTRRTCTCVFLERPRSGDPVVAATKRYALTPRESEVLRLMLRGHTTEAIANDLGVAITTSADHTKRIISKLRCHSRSQVVALVLGGL